MPARRGTVALQLRNHLIPERDVVLTGELLIVVVVEEERARELGGPATTIPPLEPARTVVDEVQTALEGESPMLREVQDDGLAVDAEADVFDCVSVSLTWRCDWNRFRTGHRYIPVHRCSRAVR